MYQQSANRLTVFVWLRPVAEGNLWTLATVFSYEKDEGCLRGHNPFSIPKEKHIFLKLTEPLIQAI